MNAPAAHIHLRSNTESYAKHTSISVPYNSKDAVKQSLNKNVGRGVFTAVPVGTPIQRF